MSDTNWVKTVISNTSTSDDPLADLDLDQLADPKRPDFNDFHDSLCQLCKDVQEQKDEMDRMRRVLNGYEITLQKQLKAITARLGEVVLLRSEIDG